MSGQDTHEPMGSPALCLVINRLVTHPKHLSDLYNSSAVIQRKQCECSAPEVRKRMIF